MFSSQTRARVVNTRMALANTKKGNTSTAEYFTKMRALGDEMNVAGRKLEDEELVEYILAGLDFKYNPVVSAVVARVEPISISELYTQVLAFEMRLELMAHPPTLLPQPIQLNEDMVVSVVDKDTAEVLQVVEAVAAVITLLQVVMVASSSDTITTPKGGLCVRCASNLDIWPTDASIASMKVMNPIQDIWLLQQQTPTILIRTGTRTLEQLII
jgi:hypothetical protein